MPRNIGDSEDLPRISSSDQKLYKSEFKHAADLFQRTLESDVKSDNMYQQDEFRKVMEESLNVLKETANALKQEKLLEQAGKIEKDLAAYQKDRSPLAADQLHKDLQRAKRA